MTGARNDEQPTPNSVSDGSGQCERNIAPENVSTVLNDSSHDRQSIVRESDAGNGVVPMPADFPMASVVRGSASAGVLVRLSRMWWLTLICFGLAVWLTWKSVPSAGPSILIHFPDGHGLKAGDSLRHRGIDIGIVSEVALKGDLSAITAKVTLTPGAGELAREGTRFWIVRPQLSLSGISGLETAVGAKYIAVSPGDPTAKRLTEFSGLAAVPADEASGEGVDVILRADQRYGVNAGSPVAWRGIDVGKILSVNLSPDARFVDVHVRVDAAYLRLLRTNSKFWVISGLGVDVGLSGVRINAESLSTMIRGGVAFATPGSDGTAIPVEAGHIFTLHRQPDPEWLTAASTIPLIDVALPRTVTVSGSRKTTLLGIPRTTTFTQHGMLIRQQDGILTLLTVVEGNDDGEHSQAAESQKKDSPAYVVKSPVTPDSTAVSSDKDVIQKSANGVAYFRLDPAQSLLPENPDAQLRIPTTPEECCVARTVLSNGRESNVIQSVGRHQLEAADGLWKVTIDNSDLTAWHGAPVVAMSDGKVIGLFMASKTGPMIAPLEKRAASP